MTLAETQALFHEAITSPSPLPAERLEACFAGTTDLPAAERVAIYANMYLWRLVDALRETFPNLVRHLGDERFAAQSSAQKLKEGLALRILVRLPLGVPLHREYGSAVHFSRYRFNDAIWRRRFDL